jgi:hypothetical protein
MDKKIIAVVGFETIRDFKIWCDEEKMRSVSTPYNLAFDSLGNEYVGIFREEDLYGRRFDEVFDIDELRVAVYRRVNNG